MENLFDPNKARGPSEDAEVVGGRGSDVTAEFVTDAGDEAMTVSELLADVKAALAARMPRRVVVVGEISNLSRPRSGHVYFSLKDADSQIPVAMFRSAAAKLRFEPQDGLEVVAEGRVDVYEAQGRLQLYATRLTPRGAGALELAFRQRVAKLGAEGLFDAAAKKPIPRYPRTICVITSATGAAIRDIRQTLSRRWPAARMLLIGVLVQGDKAAGQIARAIRAASRNAERLGIDTLIVGRGGGSLEDLWCFNEEAVARAIWNCRIPVISGVGHEVDTTIADMVADVRAATPTAAAELATPDRAELGRHLRQLADRLSRNVRERLDRGAAALRLVQRSEFFRNPLHRVHGLGQHVDELAAAMRAGLLLRRGRAQQTVAELAAALRWGLGGLARRKAERLSAAAGRYAASNPIQRVRLARRDLAAHERHLPTLTTAVLAAAAAKVDRYERTLEALSYRNVLRRGFSVTRDGRGEIVRSVDGVEGGRLLRTELADGEIRSIVEGSPKRKPKRRDADADEPTLFS